MARKQVQALPLQETWGSVAGDAVSHRQADVWVRGWGANTAGVPAERCHSMQLCSVNSQMNHISVTSMLSPHFKCSFVLLMCPCFWGQAFDDRPGHPGSRARGCQRDTSRQ